MTRRLLRRLHRDQRGGVLVFVVGFIPVAIAVGAFVIDMGNGFEHRRHLQTQADAGVLAAAQEFSGCFLDEDATNAAIELQALDYSGAVHNEQIGPPDAQSRVDPRINATSYDAASYSDGEPCDTGFVDLKLTEKDAPPFFAFVGNHDYRAHARVQAFRLRSSDKMLPIAVEDPTPEKARAIFVDEATGDVLAKAPLDPKSSQNGLAIWDNSAAPADVPITAEHVGVRVALGGASSTDCADALVACYDQGDPNRGIVHIQGWSGEGTVAQYADGSHDPPRVRSVTLERGTEAGRCDDPYFSSSSGTCTIHVRATVDFGPDAVATVGAKLTANVGGRDYGMVHDPATGEWSSGVVPVPPLSGPQDVVLEWERSEGKVRFPADNDDGYVIADCKRRDCKGSFGVQQRVFSATPDRSGKIALAQVSEDSQPPWANSLLRNSLQPCTTAPLPSCRRLVVKIGVEGTLALSQPDDPPVRMRVAEGSQTQLLDCAKEKSVVEELATGCPHSYTRNTGRPCPGNATALWATPEPWDCVAAETGDKTNAIPQGLNRRILGSEKPTDCTAPNHWPNYQAGDPRILLVFITPFGAFSGSGQDTKPVLKLATFYVTGWTGRGSGFNNPCQDEGDDPAEPAEIVGHFINYTEITNDGGAGDNPCDFGSIDACTAVLVE